MNGEIVIQVENLSKLYRLGVINHGTLYRDLQSWWARLRGKEDPNAKVVDSPIEAHRVIGKDQFLALDDVSFQVNRGEILGVIGKNGAGKSTLLKVLSRITAPSFGIVKLRGRVATLLEVGTGFHPELTGRENIYLNGAILGMTKNDVHRQLDGIISFAEIEKFIDTPVKRYSSGMYVRLAFAVAAHLEPEIMIVDEVLAVGDYRFQKKCLGRMQDISREGRTIIFVSHNMGAIRSLCTRGVLLHDGRITIEGSVEEVVDGYLASAADTDASVTYPDDPGKDIQISRVTVYDAKGTESGYLDMLKPFTVEVEYTVHRDVSGVVISCQLNTQYGESLLATADHDVERSRLGTRRRGRHVTRVEMPEQLLNSGVLNLVLGISIPGKVIYDRREALSIELFDSGSFVVDGGGEERRNSLLLLALPWE